MLDPTRSAAAFTIVAMRPCSIATQSGGSSTTIGHKLTDAHIENERPRATATRLHTCFRTRAIALLAETMPIKPIVLSLPNYNPAIRAPRDDRAIDPAAVEQVLRVPSRLK